MPTIAGTIERIVFRNEETHYTVARLRPNDAGRLFRSELITLVGALPGVSVGELVDITGEWETHPQHGRHLRVVSFTSHAPVTPRASNATSAPASSKGLGQRQRSASSRHLANRRWPCSNWSRIG